MNTVRGSGRLPMPLEALLLTAQRHEQGESLLSRRATFRTTRIVIGGILDAGYTSSAIAAVLSVTPESVRRRTEPDGALSDDLIITLTGLSAEDLQGRATRHGLQLRRAASATPPALLALDIVRLLVVD